MNGLFDPTRSVPQAPVPSGVEQDRPAVPERLGPYRIVASIGHGGMGAVYKAQDPETGQVVALKTVLLPRRELLQSIRREILALARLQHPGIVRIVGQGVEGGLPWYAMELVEGVSLGRFAAEARGETAGAPEPTLTGSASAPPAHPGAAASSGLWSEALQARTQLEVWAASGDAPSREAEPRGARRAAAQGPVPDEAVCRILSVGRGLCLALAYLHGEGIVHRDLKPGNVMVRPDGTPVIVDFGLAADWPLAKLGKAAGPSAGLESRETLQTGGLFAGTVAYMSPEQLAGELVDARADLYALGCILYELLTGRRLFGPRRLENLQPLRSAAGSELPEGWAEPLPPRLEPLLRGLLAREPQQRIGYASAAAAILLELGAEETAGSRAPQVRAYLYRPRFIGRSAPLRQLEQSLAALKGGRGGLVLLRGESGAGKTRLAMELCARAAARGVEVLVGECLLGAASEGVAPGEVLQALRRPLRAMADQCRERGEAETRRLFGDRARLLALYEPSLAELPGVAAAAEAQDVAPLPPHAARLRLFNALTESFSALAEAGAVLLVLDDLQWADELTTGFVEHLVGSGLLERRGLLVVGTVRSEEAAAWLEGLLKNARTSELRLERFGPKDIGEMVQDMLALATPPAVFVEFLARQSEGNPLFVAEYLRTAVAQRVLYQDEAGRWCVAEPERRESGAGSRESGVGRRGTRDAAHPTPDTRRPTPGYEALPLPLSVRELMLGRLAALGEGARRLAEVAAVLGREAPERLLFEVAEKLLPDVLEAVEELVVREVLEELRDEPGQAEAGAGRRFPVQGAEGRGSGGVGDAALASSMDAALARWRVSARAPRGRSGRSPSGGPGVRFRFLHDKLREVAYQAIEEVRLPPLHRAAAEAIEPLPASERDGHLAALGFHWERAGEPLRARPAYLAAARVAFARSALSDSEPLYRACLRLAAEPDAESISALHELGAKVLHLQGRNTEAREVTLQALEASRALGLRKAEAGSLKFLGILAWLTREVAEACALLEAALAILRDLDDPVSEAQTLNVLGIIRMQQGRLDEARGLYQRAVDLAREAGAPECEAVTLGNLGILANTECRRSEARALYERAAALFRESGNRQQLASLLQNLGFHHHEAGDLELAEAALVEALAIQQELEDQRNEIFSYQGLGWIEEARGRTGRAREHLERALALGRAAGEPRACALSLSGLARVELDEGSPENARTFLDEGLDQLRGLDIPGTQAFMLRELARLERLAGTDKSLPRRLLRQSSTLQRRSSNPLGEGLTLCQKGHEALASNRSAARRLREARKLAVRLELGPRSQLGRAIERLERAQAAFLAGQPLLRGECAEDLPAWLSGRSNP
jgi:tetratricopeptide (TPR) repeat protein